MVHSATARRSSPQGARRTETILLGADGAFCRRSLHRYASCSCRKSQRCHASRLPRLLPRGTFVGKFIAWDAAGTVARADSRVAQRRLRHHAGGRLNRSLAVGEARRVWIWPPFTIVLWGLPISSARS